MKELRNEERRTFGMDFDSINEFYTYLCETPLNEAFRWSKCCSQKQGSSFYGTNDFPEAVELLKNGWHDMAGKLTKKLATKEKQVAPVMKQRMQVGVAGFQPVVARYLAGDPMSMMTMKNTPVKQKVINITKSINYHGGTSTFEIEEESIKAMMIVKKLEAQGLRCNLYIALGSDAGRQIFCRVKIKGANERLNVSKLAFPMVHPSMLRRLFFRYIEVNKDVTKSFTDGYGRPIDFETMKKMYEDSIVLPAKFGYDVSEIHSLDDLKSKLNV